MKAHWKLPVAVMEVLVGSGPKLRGVIAVRTNKAWLDKAEGAAIHGVDPRAAGVEAPRQRRARAPRRRRRRDSDS